MKMKIIVLTPIKNEEWILERFLKATSLFADCIIIADQFSTDKSISICNSFPKVKLIQNTNKEYSEADRQILLIETARNLFPTDERVLFCLDADEIISGDSLNAEGWSTILQSPKGTVFKFEKPTIFFDPAKTIRYPDGWPLAYKDDGAVHKPSVIHSTRVPTPDYAKQVFINDIKFLHLCFVRQNIQFSKNRFYCAIENVNKVRSLRMRRVMYSRYKPDDYKDEGEIKPTQNSWFEYYDNNGIDLRNFQQQKYHWMDFEVLKMFQKHGTSKFFNDSIWHFDWEACRIEALARNTDGIPANPISTPSDLRIVSLDIFFMFLNRARTLNKKFFRSFSKLNVDLNREKKSVV